MLDISSSWQKDVIVESGWLVDAFGAGLRRVREEVGLTQEELASRAGLSRTSVVNIEHGRQGVSLATLYDLARALDAAPASLLPSPPREGDGPRIAIGGDSVGSRRAVDQVLRRLEDDRGGE